MGTALALSAALAIWAPMARADTAACTYDASAHTATVNVTSGAGPVASISILPFDGSLYVYSGFSDSKCGAATRTNLDLITVNGVNNTGIRGSILYLGMGTPFAPGFTNEPGGSDEIEMALNLTGGGRWILGIDDSKTTTPLDLALGASGLNFNAGETDGVDADATVSGAIYAYVLGSTVSDRVAAGGGPGVPGPFGLPIVTSSGAGADLLVGGRRADDLSGGLDNDVVIGGKGKDDLKGEGGVDTLLGKAGADKLLGGPAKDKLNGGKGTDRCTVKHDKHKSCEVPTQDKS